MCCFFYSANFIYSVSIMLQVWKQVFTCETEIIVKWYIYIYKTKPVKFYSDVNPKKKTIVNFYHPFLCVWLLFIIIPNSFTIPVLKIYINILKYVWRASVRLPSVDEWLTRLIFFLSQQQKNDDCYYYAVYNTFGHFRNDGNILTFTHKRQLVVVV